MGIESDQLVFDYLSRVGDLAQQRQLPSATRMRLVSELRNEIDRRRAKAPVDSPSAVRRILSRLGTPDDIVAAAREGAPEAGTDTWAAVPTQRAGEDDDRPKGLRRVVPRPRPAVPKPTPRPTEADDAPSPPHLASTHELGDGSADPDWWRKDTSAFGLGDSVPGFVGGVEIPELLKPPPRHEDGDEDESDSVEEAGPKPAKSSKSSKFSRAPKAPRAEKAAAVEEADVAVAPRRRLPRPGNWSNPLLLLAAVLLVVGAALGNWFALGLGWLIAWASRRLSPVESKWAVLGMPGLAVTAGVVWLWGRTDGRWGDPIVKGHMNEAVAQTWPWVVRGAAVASALYLVWRSQRRR
ncbi:hypothetical protein SMIR_20735 [Streptomyces mirabilis]|uniref:hypothetical protein n=1 Tax=Streptomyces mirabilis TaxID=68239 RepID=UPI001BAF5940|nr:hypothetical protein [Streptomyces mirabilis]QUW81238.1 hypothetical protein SMIR_20735 [Streptomyces mirabilis]